jgi:hypothetical protein
VAAARKADVDTGTRLAEGPQGGGRVISWHTIEDRSDVQAYLAAFDAYVQAGGTNAPAVAADLKGATFTELVEAR